MENLQTSYEFKVWTDDFIIPKEINLKSIKNNNPYSTTPLFLIELRVQEFVQYLPESEDSIVEEARGPFIVESLYLPSNAVIRDDAADDSICEILSSIGVPLNSMLPIIQEVSSYAQTMMSLPANLDRPLLPVVLGIAVNSWDPRDTATSMSSVSISPQQELKMENLQTTYDFKVWTDDFIIPKMINLKKNSITTLCFMIELRVQEYVQYLPKKGNSIVEEPRGSFIVESFYLPSNAAVRDDAVDDSLCEILSSVGVPLYRMLPIIREVSSFARTMMSLPANLGRPLLPIVIGIAVNSWDPRDAAIAHKRIKDEHLYRVCLTPY